MSTKLRFVEKKPPKITKGHPFTDQFGLPDLAPQGNVILMFKVSGKAGSVLNITTPTMLAEDLPTIVLDDKFTQPRAWIEVLSHKDFAETGNKITMELADPAEGHEVTVSDIVILYSTKTA